MGLIRNVIVHVSDEGDRSQNLQTLDRFVDSEDAVDAFAVRERVAKYVISRGRYEL